MSSTSTAYHTLAFPAIGFVAALALLPSCTSGRAVASTMVPATPPVALKAVRPFFIPGETITWSVSLAGVEGGRARLAIGAAGDVDGRRLVVLRAEAESAGLLAMVRRARDAVSSWVDVETGLPTRTESETFGLEKNVKVHAARSTDEPICEFRVWNRAKPTVDGEAKTLRLPMMETHDPLSAILVLRAWEATPGARAVMYSLGGVRVWRTELVVEGREVMKTELGKRATIRIQGTARRLVSGSLEEDKKRPPRTFTVWMTDDDERLPVQITAHTEYGDVVAKATSYEVAAALEP